MRPQQGANLSDTVDISGGEHRREEVKVAKQTIDRRLAAATARQQNALGLFEKAAAELDAAADEANAIAAQANAQAERFIQVREDAEAQRAAARKRAAKIREFIK